MSVGVLLNNGFLMRGSSAKIAFYHRGSHSSVLETFPHMPGQTVFWLTARFSSQQSSLAKSTVFTIDYDLWHKHFGHPSKQVLKEAQGHVKNFPKDLAFPKKDPIYCSCAEGKMHSHSFPESQSHASRPFERIHSDLKSFPVDSYHRYKYLISFFDDCTSHAWVVLLCTKNDVIDAAHHFIIMVKTQHGVQLKEWMSDAGGEYKSTNFDTMLKGQGIKVLKSVPHQLQQNGCAECFNRTIMDKAQALCLDACLPQSWWEFAVLHAVHLYNRTPIRP